MTLIAQISRKTESSLDRIKEWLLEKPRALKIFEGSQFFFSGVACASLLLSKTIYPISLAIALPLVSTALAVASYALYRWLSPHPDTLQELFEITFADVTSHPDLDRLLAAYLTEEKVYHVLFSDYLSQSDRLFLFKMPHEIKLVIKQMKNSIKAGSEKTYELLTRLSEETGKSIKTYWEAICANRRKIAFATELLEKLPGRNKQALVLEIENLERELKYFEKQYLLAATRRDGIVKSTEEFDQLIEGCEELAAHDIYKLLSNYL